MMAAPRPTKKTTQASQAGYWAQSRRPLTSLAFALPLLLLYEGGVLAMGPAAVRNGADVWLRQLLDSAGLTSYFLLPILTAGILLGWHYTTRDRWRISTRVLGGMLVESAVLGFLLMLLAHLQGSLFSATTTTESATMPFAANHDIAAAYGHDTSAVAPLGKLFGYFGAGIYEEVLFRLLLLPTVAGIIGLLGVATGPRLVMAALMSSLAFSAAHYLGPHGENLDGFSFLFRFVAGGFFAGLFVFRGFGIAAGSHALYDVFVGMR